MAIDETPRMHMGCDLLDLLCGGAKGRMGPPFGSILQIMGDSSSGKSLLKNEIIARNYHEDPDHFQWFSDDCESGDTFDTEAIWGVETRPIGKDGCLHIGKKAVSDSTTIEELDAQVSLFLEHLGNCDKGTHGFYAIDSLDGLADATREKDEETRLNQLKKGQEVKDPGSYGAELAKFLSQKFLRLKHHKLKEMQCTLFVISQTREKMNALPFQQKWSVASGKAMEFYCHTRIFLRTIRKIVKEDRVIGAVVSAETMKSKTPRPFRKVVYTVYFDYGIDNIGSNLDYLFDLLTDKGEIDKEKAAAVKWVPGLDFNKDTALAWLKETGWETLCRKDRQKIEGKNQLSCDWIKQWVFEQGEDPEGVAEGVENLSDEAQTDLAERVEGTDVKPEAVAAAASNGPTRQERIEAFEKTFGKCYTRDELIEMIDADETRAMAQELTDRVIAKWESIEDSVAVAPHRRPKYGPVKREAAEDAVAQSF